MSGRRAPKKTPDERMRERVSQLEGLVESQAATIELQAQRIEQQRLDLIAATTKPARLFRGRTIEHGPLKLTIKPVEQIADAEIYLKQDGDVVVILIGDAARLARTGVRGDWAVPTQAPTEIAPPAPTSEAVAAAVAATTALSRRMWDQLTDFQRKQVQKNLQAFDDVSAAIDYGAQFGLRAEEVSELSVNADLTTGMLPAELTSGPPNVSLQPQRDPRVEGGFQLRDEVAAANAREVGWNGLGRRPPGWVDPHAPAKEQPSN